MHRLYQVRSGQVRAAPAESGVGRVAETADCATEQARGFVVLWEGGAPGVVDLPPGTHMIAHDDVDGPMTARIAWWGDAFAATPTNADTDGHWWGDWLAVLARSSELAPTDDRAIIRDNRPPRLSHAVAAHA